MQALPVQEVESLAVQCMRAEAGYAYMHAVASAITST